MAGKSFFMHKNSAGLCTNSLHKSALLFCNKQIDGKKSVLSCINNVNTTEQQNQFCCLIDRDLDFILDQTTQLQNVFYYDYYELENYLMSEQVILKILLAIKHKYRTISVLEDVTLISSRIDELDVLFKDFAFLNLLREFNYHEKIPSERLLNDTEIEKIVSLSSKNHVSKLNHYCKSLNLTQSLQKIFDDELKICSLDMSKLQSRYPEIQDIMSKHSILKYLVDGKRIMGMFLLAIKHIFLNSEKNDIQDFHSRVKNEWIPCYSEEFNLKVREIENYFNIPQLAI